MLTLAPRLRLRPRLCRLAAVAMAGAAMVAFAQSPTGATPGFGLAEPQWLQAAPAGRDAAVSHDGERWFVDTEGRARRWMAASGAWAVHGARNDLLRIDAGSAGAVALSRSGEVFVTSASEGDDWRALGVRAADVGLGGGRLWLADAQASGNGSNGAPPAVLHAPFDASGRTPAWERIEGRFTRIDADPAGRPWALDAAGRLHVHDGRAWQLQREAPPAQDVGVGGQGAVVLVGRAAEGSAAPGALFARAPGGAAWRPWPAQLSAVSVDAEGRVFGIHDRAWVLVSVATAEGDPGVVVASADPGPPKDSGEGGADASASTVTLAALAGPGVPLPAGIAAAPVTWVQGNAASGTYVGRTRLNGLETQVVRYTPPGGTQPVLALGHASLAVADYLPELAATGARTLRLTRPVFFFTAPDAGARAPLPADGAVLQRVFGRSDLAALPASPGVSLQATLDPRQVPAVFAASSMLGLGQDAVAVSALGVSPVLFTRVAPGAARPDPAPVTWAAFRAQYQQALSGLVLRAPVRELDGRSLGPARLKAPVLSLAMALADSGAELELALEAQLALNLLSAGLNETLQVDDARLALAPLTRAARLSGTVTRQAADELASWRGLQLQSATLSGDLVLGPTAAAAPTDGGGPRLPVEALELVADARGRVPMLRLEDDGRPQASAPAGVDVDLQIALALDDAKTALVPTVTAQGSLSLADLTGIDSPAARGVQLRELRWTPGTVEGRASLYGLTVRAVRHQAGTAPPVVALAHQELDLATYVPRLRGVPQLGSLSLSNAVAFVLPENAPARTYATRAEMPEGLAKLLDRPEMPDEQIFPLRLAPGVTVVGQIDTTEAARGGITRQAMAAWGLAGQRYVLKGSFRASALRNASFGTATRNAADEARTVSARDVACAALGAADQLPTEGLDVSFPVPAFQPPFAGQNLRFSNTRFAIKDIDGQLEPALVTALRVQLPSQASSQLQGLNALDLAAKLQVKGDLRVLCQGITPETDGEMALAGVTAFNPQQIASVAFRSLDRLSADELPPEPPESEATAAAPALPPGVERLLQWARASVEQLKPKLGWKGAFGLPFLTVNQLGVSGVIAQKDGERSLTGTVWTDSVLGSEPVDVLGRISLKAADAQSDFAVSGWRLLAAGPIKLTGLPGMAALNRRLPALELSDLTVSRLSLAPTALSGRLALPSRRMRGDVVFTLSEDGTPEAPAFELYAGVNRFAPNWLLKPEAQLPGAVGALTLGSSFFALRGAATVQQQTVGELPAPVKALLSAATGPLLDDESQIPLLRGLSLAGRLNPAELSDAPAWAPVKGAFTLLGVTGPVPLLGGVEAAAPGSADTNPKGAFLEALVANASVPGLPDGSAASLRALRLSLSARDGRRITGAGLANFTLPASLREALGQPAPSNARVQLAYEADPAGERLLQWSAATDIDWPVALSLPDLNLGQLAIGVATRQREGQPVSSRIELTAEGRYRETPVKARLRSEQLAQAGERSGHRLVELTAREPEGRLNLATLLNPLALLPEGYEAAAGPGALFGELTANKLLLSRATGSGSGSGRVTLAALDVTGRLREQPFSGQLAVVGITSARPSLFVRSDAPLAAGQVFGPLAEGSALSDVALPQGLVILSPLRSNLALSEVHAEIAEKVFAGLQEAGTDELLANAGLTVLARVPLPEGVPAVLQDLVPWLPGNGQLLLGLGLERATPNSPRTLALFADAQGLALRVPAHAQSVVKSVGGQVQLSARSEGQGAAARVQAELQTDATVLVPRLSQPGSREINTRITLQGRRQPGGDGDLLLQVQTDLQLPPWLSLPQLSAGNFALELATRRRGATTANSVALSADVSLASVKAKARLGLDTQNGGFDGGLVELIAAEEGGRFDLASLLAPLISVPASYGALGPGLSLAPWNYLRSFSTSGVLLARAAGSDTVEVAARDVRGQLNDQTFVGQFAAVVRPSGPVLFVRSDTPLTASRVFPSPVQLGPFGALGLPEGLVILSPQNGDVNLSTLHPRIYEEVFASFFASPASAIVPAKNGLAVLAKLDLGGSLPPPLNLVSGWLPGSGKLIVGGGIEDAASAAPKIAFYANVEGLTLRVPPPLDAFVQTVGGGATFFFKTKGGAGAGVELGLQTAVQLKAPRLDTLEQQPVNATLDLTASSEAGMPGALTVGATVNGTWSQPLGLAGFALTDTGVDIGVSSNGFIVNINAERAEFTSASGEKKALYLDLLSAWTPAGVPTQLSVQAGKSPTLAGDLLLSPQVLAEVGASVLQLGMKGGSALANQVRARLQASVGQGGGATAAALAGFDALAQRLQAGGNAAAGFLGSSPLGFVAVRNPVVFFATPGNELPPRQGVPQPPFGLGLRVGGQFVFTPGFGDGALSKDMAEGQARLDLLNGLTVSGRLTAPAPLGGQLTISGSQPLGQGVASALRVEGDLSVAGASLPGAGIRLDFSRSPALPLPTDLNIAGTVTLAGVSRSASMNLRGTTLTVNAAPLPCVPGAPGLSGSLSLPTTRAQDIVGLVSVNPPSIGSAIECANVIADLAVAGAQAAAQVATVTAQAVANVTTQAAQVVASNVANFVNNPGRAINAVGSWIGGGGRSVCNQRIEWLRARGNRPDPPEVDDMVNRIYRPMQTTIDQGREFARLMEMHARYVNQAHGAFETIAQYWNAHPLRDGAPLSFGSHHNGTDTQSFDHHWRTGQLRANAALLERGNREGSTTRLKALLDWRDYAGFESGGPWKGRNEAEWLWARCAAAWNADLPIKTARVFGIPYPLHQDRWGNLHHDAMFMPRDAYLKVRQDLATFVQARAQQNQQHMDWMRGYTANWVQRSRSFYTALLSTAVAGVPMQPGAPDSTQGRYNATAVRLRDEALEILKLQAKVHPCQVMRTLDNLLRYKAELKTGQRPSLGAQIPSACGKPNYPRGAGGEWQYGVLDPLWYLGNNPDVRQVMGNTLEAARQHWIQYGIHEGRASAWNFHARTYGELNTGLLNFYGGNLVSVTNHWMTFGLSEGRVTVKWLD